MFIQKQQTYRKGLVSSTIFNILAKGLFFFNSILIAYLFGAGNGTDFYFFLTSLLLLISNYINGVDLLVIIPESMQRRERTGHHAEMSYINFFLYLYFGIGLFITILITVIGPVNVFSVISKFSIQAIETNTSMIFLSLAVLPLMLVTNFLTSVLTSHRFFTAPMIVSLINSVLTTILLFSLHNKLSIVSAMIALMSGYTLNLLWLFFIMKKKLHWNFFIPVSIPHKKNFQDLGLIVLNIFPVSLRSYLIIFFLSGLGAGTITAVNYGQQIASIPEVFISAQVISVAGIKMTELSAKNKFTELSVLFDNILKLLFFLLIPVACLLMINSFEIVSVIFMKNEIGHDAKTKIALVLLFIAAILPVKALDASVTKLVTSLQKIKEGFWYGTLMHILITIIVVLGIHFWQLKGFLSSTVISYFVVIPVVFYFLCKKIAPFVHYKKAIADGARIAIFNAAIAVIVYYVSARFFAGIHPIVTIICSSMLYFVLLFFANRIFALNTQLEQTIITALKKKYRKKND